MEIKKLSNIDLLALIRTVSLELENRECEVTKYVEREIPSTVDRVRAVKFTAEAYSAALQLSKSINQQRAELIQRAREFISNNTLSNGSVYYARLKMLHDARFVINAEKRTVVCLLSGAVTKRVYSKGIAKCMPGDVFHTDIGKAIALAKALQIDIPQEFMKAVQPDVPAVGHVMRWDESYRVDGKDGEQYNFTNLETGRKYFDLHYEDSTLMEKLIDDTNAEYDFESVGE